MSLPDTSGRDWEPALPPAAQLRHNAACQSDASDEADWSAEETAVAGVWADERHEDLDERAFACAVGAEEAEDDALFDLHGEPVECLDPVGVGLGDVGEVEGEGHG